MWVGFSLGYVNIWVGTVIFHCRNLCDFDGTFIRGLFGL